MNRRYFLASTGATALAAATRGVWFTNEGCVLVPTDKAAYNSWTNWSAGGEPGPLKLVRAAILASSPHNTQPWRFRVAASFVEFYLDPNRKVNGLDPYLREAHIGMGCALENLILAAHANGYSTQITLPQYPLVQEFTSPQLRLVARVDLTPGAVATSELYDAIPKRHTNRSIYDPAKELPPNFVAELLSVCNTEDDARLILFSREEQRAALIQLSVPANFEIYSDPIVEQGSEEWIRWRAADVSKYKDGIGIDNLGLSPFTTALAKITPTSLLKRASAPASRSALYEKQMRSARLIAIIAVRDRLRSDSCLKTGRIWQRAHLLATARGIGARPCNETIEMIDHERHAGKPEARLSALANMIDQLDLQPNFLILFGYPTLPAHPSPRRPVEEVATT